MFRDAVKNILKMFEDSTTLELSEEELVAIGNRKTPILKEGIKIIKNKLTGSIIFTKNIGKGENISSFLIELVKNLQFPGYLFLDFAGFLIDSEEKPVFVFPSVNSSVDLLNNSGKTPLLSKTQAKQLIEVIQGKTNQNFLSEWFLSHDSIGNFTRSGLRPKKLINISVFFFPLFEKAEDLFT